MSSVHKEKHSCGFGEMNVCQRLSGTIEHSVSQIHDKTTQMHETTCGSSVYFCSRKIKWNTPGPCAVKTLQFHSRHTQWTQKTRRAHKSL